MPSRDSYSVTVVDTIFQVPKKVRNEAPSPVLAPGPYLPSAYDLNIAAPGSSTELHGGRGNLRGWCSMNLDCRDGGVPEDDHSNSDIDFKGTPVMIPG